METDATGAGEEFPKKDDLIQKPEEMFDTPQHSILNVLVAIRICSTLPP